ncbi:MAG: bifunctional phosphopantothenoylcysteine decarboxylase/phosphopantothenate--cysteine ligase CoaBC [Ruminococcus sp.]|nr:bifunctional phosphopantothenoylcysteine decarboxylase/phosphopantothenate--cysteine ligase CoaBC [Ruminococcus sp.]
MQLLKGKTVVLAVSGGIAAYKIPNLARMLIKQGARVQVVMTKNATHFITPFTFSTLTKQNCLVDTFEEPVSYSVEHVALAKQADLVLVAPATANVIGKLANGLADDMLTTTILACTCPILIAPAMNHNMLHNPMVEENIQKLSRFYTIIPPEHGMLANGDDGDGRMPSEEVLLDYVLQELAFPKDLSGQTVLVTAGATQEPMDPVRYITNHSTGKMGYAIAQNAARRGASVTLISGKTTLPVPRFVQQFVPIVTAEELHQAVVQHAAQCDLVIMSAAVADYRPTVVQTEKIKKHDTVSTLSLERTTDILAELGQNKRPGQYLCGFSMETESLLENSRKKLEQKNLDLIVANNLKQPGAGFAIDTNLVTLLTKEETVSLPLLSKEAVAEQLLTFIQNHRA